MEVQNKQGAHRPLVSVVTPFHNTAEYLEECIISVLRQTYEYIEYILVDNCSTDDSRAIAERHAAQDSRVRILSTEKFLSQTENYNYSLQQISPASKYVKMVQADDWIFPRCIEEMVQVAELGTNVGVVGSYTIYGEHIGHLRPPPFSEGPIYAGLRAGQVFLTQESAYLGSQTGVMLRSDLVRKRSPFFLQEYSSCNDAEAFLALLRESSLGFVFQVLTYNRRGNPGFWTRIQDFEPLMLEQYVLLRHHGPHFFGSAELATLLAERTKTYYAMLAYRLLAGESAAFWDFHIGQLEAAGFRFERWLLLKHLLAQIVKGSVRHPLQTLRALARLAASRRAWKLLTQSAGMGRATQEALT